MQSFPLNYALQLLLDLDVASIGFVWILPPLEVDPVWKNGVGVEVKVDGVVVISLEENGTNLRDEVCVLRDDSYRYDSLSCIFLWREMDALFYGVSKGGTGDSRSIFVTSSQAPARVVP